MNDAYLMLRQERMGLFMYVCICKGVTENQLRDAIRGGLCTRKEISRCLKVGTACGKCNQEVRDLLQRSLSAGASGAMARRREEGPQTAKMPAPTVSPGGSQRWVRQLAR